MAKRAKPGPRSGTQRLSVYNEGLCVYLHDEGHDVILRKMMDSPKFGKQSPDATFVERLESPKFGAEAARKGLACAFELEQDDEIDIEVMVGAPPGPDELADALWMAPQLTWLHLPTGRLRIDTPNTMPLDPDAGDDKGGVATVPPGDYDLRIYRIDWHAMHREDKSDGYKGPGHLLVLTPRTAAPNPLPKSAVLLLPEEVEDLPKASACRVMGETFTSIIHSDFWWEPFQLVISRTAAHSLGLTPGRLFELRWEIPFFRLVVAFLDEPWDKPFYPLANSQAPESMKPAFEKFAVAHAEPAIALWQEDESLREHLLIVRWGGKQKYPAKYHDVWVPCTGRVLDDPSPFGK